MIVIRLNSDGSFDDSFGVGGKMISFETRGVSDFKILENGAILILGTKEDINGNRNPFLARITDVGELDLLFGTAGYVNFDFGSGYNSAGKLKVKSDNKILFSVSGTNSEYLIQCNPDGTFDTNFATSGVLTMDAENGLGDFYVLSDDKIVFTNYGTGAIVLKKYNSNGTVDLTFGLNGTTSTSNSNHMHYCTNIELIYPMSHFIYS